MYQSGEIDRFITLLIYLRTTLADIYIIARSYKIMYNLDLNLDKPLINACYFGALHTKNMKDFLIKKNGENKDYNLIMEISNFIDDEKIYKNDVNNNRCIEIKQNLDMRSLIKRLIDRRTPHLKTLFEKYRDEQYKAKAKIVNIEIKQKAKKYKDLAKKII